MNRWRRAIVRHGVTGCLTLAARYAAQSLSAVLYRHERHIWYVVASSAVNKDCTLPEGLKLQRSGPEHLDLLSSSKLYGWSAGEAFFQEGGDLWIVLDGKRAAFCCWMFRERMPTVAAPGGWKDLPAKTVCLEGVVTDAEYRGRGIAPAAWALIAQHVNQEGMQTITMKVEAGNQSMRRAVAKAGFHEVAMMDYLSVAGLSRVQVTPLGNGTGEDRDILMEVQKLEA